MTDFALRATKVTAWSLGQVMSTMVVPECHLWLNLAQMSDGDKCCFLDAPISQAGLCGDTEDFAQQFSAVQKQTEAMKHILPWHDVVNTRPPSARSSTACRRGHPPVASTPAPPQETPENGKCRGLSPPLLPREPVSTSVCYASWVESPFFPRLPHRGYVGNCSIDPTCTQTGGLVSSAQPISLADPGRSDSAMDSVNMTAQAPGAYGSCSDATQPVTYETATALAARPDPEMGMAPWHFSLPRRAGLAYATGSWTRPLLQ
ncbi:tRNA dimethylallyltransferase [Labeo rohita]|uniref:tRNA dimethylallyltransferase n=1 Tax=Labeo rohita TaxID=84645 RepID=A0ABQ8LY85_LABRO|nr:tRNA dimethylallyltransferase [Labeo rohita]